MGSQLHRLEAQALSDAKGIHGRKTKLLVVRLGLFNKDFKDDLHNLLNLLRKFREAKDGGEDARAGGILTQIKDKGSTLTSNLRTTARLANTIKKKLQALKKDRYQIAQILTLLARGRRVTLSDARLRRATFRVNEDLEDTESFLNLLIKDMSSGSLMFLYTTILQQVENPRRPLLTVTRINEIFGDFMALMSGHIRDLDLLNSHQVEQDMRYRYSLIDRLLKSAVEVKHAA